MLLGNSLVTKECWEPVLDHIQECFRKGQFFKMHGRSVYTMHFGHEWLFVAATCVGDAVDVHGWVLLEKPFQHWECWEVGQSFVFPEVRGAGWGKLLYDTIIRSEGMILASGFKQSKNGQRIWRAIAKSDSYKVWAHDFANPEVFEPVIVDEETGQPWSALPIYQKTDQYKPWKQDIRLIAIRKK